MCACACVRACVCVLLSRYRVEGSCIDGGYSNQYCHQTQTGKPVHLRGEGERSVEWSRGVWKGEMGKGDGNRGMGTSWRGEGRRREELTILTPTKTMTAISNRRMVPYTLMLLNRASGLPATSPNKDIWGTMYVCVGGRERSAVGSRTGVEFQCTS